MSDYDNETTGCLVRGALFASLMAFAVAVTSTCTRRSYEKKEKQRQKIEQQQIVRDSLRNTIEYREALKVYKNLQRKQAQIESGLRSVKAK